MGISDEFTLALALLGAGLGVFNTVVGYRRGRVRWKVVGVVKPLQDGQLSLRVELINTGRIPVKVEQVVLARSVKGAITTSQPLTDDAGHPGFPLRLPPGEKRAIDPVHGYTLDQVLVLQPFVIVAKSEDGRIVKARCPGLRELYDQMQAAKAKHST